MTITRVLVYIGILGLVMFWFLKRPRRYIERLPKDLDPKAPEARSFWYRSPQNKRRFRIGCAAWFMISAVMMGIYSFSTMYTVQRIRDAASATSAPTLMEIPVETPTPEG